MGPKAARLHAEPCLLSAHQSPSFVQHTTKKHVSQEEPITHRHQKPSHRHHSTPLAHWTSKHTVFGQFMKIQMSVDCEARMLSANP